jgi:transposase
MEQGVLTEQRTNIKFLVKLGRSGQEILEMLETVYGESVMKCRTVYKWVDWFKEGRERVDDNVREGSPSMSRVGENIQRVHDLVMSDCHVTTKIITDKLGISKSSVQNNFIRFKHAEAV